MKLKYCMLCAARLSKRSETLYVCATGHEYYNNPRAAVAVVLLNVSGRILYVKRGVEPKKDHYDLPGGFLTFREDARIAAKRLVYLETGLGLHDVKLLDIFTSVQSDEVSASSYIFLSTMWSGESEPGKNVATLEWKNLEFLNNEKFAWEYPGLYESLKPIVAKLSKKRLLL